MKKKKNMKNIIDKKFKSSKLFPCISDMAWCFIFLAIGSILITIIRLFISHGDCFNDIFFKDSLDTGMDFFHSIEYTRGRAPYELFHTQYPPLANLFFYVIFRFVPFWQCSKWASTFHDGVVARGSITDLRVWQPTLFIFVVYIITTALLFTLLIRKFFFDVKQNDILSFCALFSSGMLYAYERGNIIILAVICAMFFVFYEGSSNKYISEIALIMLAVSAGIKIYPALLGIILLYEKKYLKALRTIFYGILFFILPFFVFREGLSGLGQLLLTLFGGTKGNISVNGISANEIIANFVTLTGRICKFTVDTETLQYIAGIISITLCVMMLISGFFLKTAWQRVLAAILGFLMYRDQGSYATAFLLIPLLLMIKDEKTINKRNFSPFFALVISQLMLPLGYVNSWNISLKYLRYQICIMFLVIFIIVSAIINITNICKNLYNIKRKK